MLERFVCSSAYVLIACHWPAAIGAAESQDVFSSSAQLQSAVDHENLVQGIANHHGHWPSSTHASGRLHGVCGVGSLKYVTQILCNKLCVFILIDDYIHTLRDYIYTPITHMYASTVCVLIRVRFDCMSLTCCHWGSRKSRYVYVFGEALRMPLFAPRNAAGRS